MVERYGPAMKRNVKQASLSFTAVNIKVQNHRKKDVGGNMGEGVRMKTQLHRYTV